MPTQVEMGEESKALLERLVVFCVQQGGRCFAGWDVEILKTYLRWHARNGTLVWVSNEGGRILGIMTVRRVCEYDLEKHWTFDAAGDCLLVEQCVALRPGVLKTLVRRIQETFPDWRKLKILARRSKKDWERHRYPPELVERLAG